jgi:maleate isomerase
MSTTSKQNGRRARIGVVIPSTNTSVEADYNDLRPEEVTFHVARIFINTSIDSDDKAQETLRQIRDGSEKAVHDVCTCQPDHLIMGMSSETFVGGLEGSRALTKRMEEMSGLGVSTGSEATNLALESIGARRIAVLTPYQPSIDEQVERYFDDLGYEMVAMKSLRCPTATSIADVTGEEILEAIDELERMAGGKFDAFVQAGTNLSSFRVADEVEQRTGKPLVAINAATVWHALGQLGLDPALPAAGSVFSGGAKPKVAERA